MLARAALGSSQKGERGAGGLGSSGARPPGNTAQTKEIEE